jgi:uncharacterized protein YcfJ
MNALMKTTLTLGVLSFSTLAAAQVTFYERENFQGRSFTAQGAVESFGSSDFNDRASSAIIDRDLWEVCEDNRFGGRCVVLRPGRYSSLSAMGLDNRISSVRVANADARRNDERYAPNSVTPQITFFEGENFSGRSFTTQQPMENFRANDANDRTSSLDIVGDRWEVCEDTQFRGRCVVLGSGRYPSLASMGLNDRISSVRYVNWNSRSDSGRGDRVPDRDYGRRDNERTYEANVTSVRAVVGAAEQRCWMEPSQVPAQRSGVNVPGTVVGALVGGILGHQIGHGTTRNVATVGGAVAGGLVGNKVGGGSQAQAQGPDVQRCSTTQSQASPSYWDVTYDFRGQEHRVQMTNQPGATVIVNEQGEPRV